MIDLLKTCVNISQMATCHHIYTNKSLDGAVSTLVYMWSKSKEDSFHFTPISNSEISKLKTEIVNTHNPSKTLILKLGIREEFLPELDESHIVFIDNQKSSSEVVEKFKKAKIITKEYSSSSLLMYKALKENIEITDSKKLLIALADDFDSYSLKIPYSYDLNLLFWSEYQGRFSSFIKDYYNGFKPFTEKQIKAIEYIKKVGSDAASKSNVFSGQVVIEEKSKKLCAVMVEKIIPNMMETLIKKHNPDLFVVINTQNENVSIRQCNQDNPINCAEFAEKFCNGGGKFNSSAGKITPLFMEITKNLKPV